jgi:hypothetical protein
LTEKIQKFEADFAKKLASIERKWESGFDTVKVGIS